MDRSVATKKEEDRLEDQLERLAAHKAPFCHACGIDVALMRNLVEDALERCRRSSI